MKKLHLLLLPAMFVAFPLAASADSWKDESGHGKRRQHERREYKEEYRDGNCKVERKMEKNGDYKEERKCKGVSHDHHGHAPVHAPAPVIVIEPGIRVRGTVTISN